MVTRTGTVAAVDLGATSGRVIVGQVGQNELTLRTINRFPNGPVQHADGLRWNVTELYRNVKAGLTTVINEYPRLASIGIDSWAVDYALMKDGRMLDEPYHYRDTRTAAGVEAVHALVSPEELYAVNGLQFLPFNTLYQLTADRLSGALDEADQFLLIPDLFTYWLTGQARAEATNASTTGLLGVIDRRWDDALINRLGLARSLFPSLIDAGSSFGEVQGSITTDPDLNGVHVSAVGSHDTASAVVAIPATTDDVAYISCGTWGLVGVELASPVLTEASRLANFTNEGGVDGRIRYLHNVMGLWLLTETLRDWAAESETVDLPTLIAQADADSEQVPIFDANDPIFLPPGDMPGRITSWLRDHDLPVPSSRPAFVRCIIESLADAFAVAIRTASELSRKRIIAIHFVGGGSQNALLCQLTADRAGLPVHAGPVEATAIGNMLVQARAVGLIRGDLETLRALVAATYPPHVYTPSRNSVS